MTGVWLNAVRWATVFDTHISLVDRNGDGWLVICTSAAGPPEVAEYAACYEKDAEEHFEQAVREMREAEASFHRSMRPKVNWAEVQIHGKG